MTQTNRATLQDKKSIMLLLAGFMANPKLLGKTKEYSLTLNDFPEKIHQLLYGTMYNMFHQGVTVLNPVEIDTFISSKDMQYRLLNDNNGLEILYKLEEIGTPENLNYHYQRVKKFSFLRECKSQGIDVSDILDMEIVDVKEAEKQQQSFDRLTVDEMMKHVDEKFIDIKDRFRFNQENQGSHMSEDIESMLQGLYESPSYGNSLSSGLLTRLIRGAKRKNLIMRSSNTGGGKTRYALADLCTICIPEIWDLKEKKWVYTDANESGLFITTELSREEIQLPVLCYISGIPESDVLDANLSDGEKERLNRAVIILKNSNLFIEHLNDFDIDDIEYTIERNIVKNKVDFVCFDYIHTSMKLLTNITKSAKVTMREDQILLLMADKLKQMCNKYNIWMMTGTQLNNEWKAEGGVNLDASSLRGARSLGDKLDVGMIMLRLTKDDEKILETLRTSIHMEKEPTHTITIFKNRRGEHVAVKVWLHIDLGNLRTVDLFVTDAQGRVLADVKPVKVKYREVPKVESTQPEKDSLPDSFNISPTNSEKFAF